MKQFSSNVVVVVLVSMSDSCGVRALRCCPFLVLISGDLLCGESVGLHATGPLPRQVRRQHPQPLVSVRGGCARLHDCVCIANKPKRMLNSG